MSDAKADDDAVAALIDREFHGMGRDIVAAARAMFEAEHGADAYENATAPRRAHYRYLATVALRPALERISAERGVARAMALEEAATWHDKEIEKIRAMLPKPGVPDESETYGDLVRMAGVHCQSAGAIRALKAEPVEP